jgi:hypothetical protein
MSRYFEIDGYWKDTDEVFSGYVVKEFDDVGDDDEHVFFYGLTESDIKQAIFYGEDTVEDFVITNYREI